MAIGGWETFISGVDKAMAEWFSVDFNRKNAPWAFARGEPFRTIAALELYATLAAVVFFFH